MVMLMLMLCGVGVGGRSCRYECGHCDCCREVNVKDALELDWAWMVYVYV